MKLKQWIAAILAVASQLIFIVDSRLPQQPQQHHCYHFWDCINENQNIDMFFPTSSGRVIRHLHRTRIVGVGKINNDNIIKTKRQYCISYRKTTLFFGRPTSTTSSVSSAFLHYRPAEKKNTLSNSRIKLYHQVSQQQRSFHSSNYTEQYDVRPYLTPLAISRATEYVIYHQQHQNFSSTCSSFSGFVSPRPNKMIVFDKDGTLGDCTASLEAWTHHMTRHVQEVMTPDAFQSLLPTLYETIGWNATKNECIPSGLLAAGTWEDVITAIYIFLKDNHHVLQQSITYDQVQGWNDELGALLGEDPPLLDDLQSMMTICSQFGYKIAICTSDDRAATDAALTAWNVHNVVQHSICGNEVPEGKPSPIPLQRLCEIASSSSLSSGTAVDDHDAKEKIDPFGCIMVGDTTADTGMARNANSGYCVTVLTGGGCPEELVKTGAHLVLPNVGYIPSFLQWLDELALELID